MPIIPPVTSSEASLRALRSITENTSCLSLSDVSPVLELMKSAFSKYDLGPCWDQDSLRYMIQLWKKCLEPQSIPVQLTLEVQRDLEEFLQRPGFPFVKGRWKSNVLRIRFTSIIQKHEASNRVIGYVIKDFLGADEARYCQGLALKRGVHYIRESKVANYAELVEMYRLYNESRKHLRSRWSPSLKVELELIREFQEKSLSGLYSIEGVLRRWMIVNMSTQEMKALLQKNSKLIWVRDIYFI